VTNRQDNAGAAEFTSGAYEEYGAALRAYLRNRLRNGEDARELAQEVWTRVLRVDDPSRLLSPRAYIYRVAANVVAEFQLMRRRNPVQFDSVACAAAAESLEVSPQEDSAERLSRQNEIVRMMSALPRTYRQIVLMRICEGQSYASIGAKLGLTAGTAERYCQSALTRIRGGARKGK
jgi:RNA polymerase sigma-70 factor (ECF subfamily)